MSYNPSGGISRISTSADVSLTNLSDQQQLAYNTTTGKWQNVNPPQLNNKVTSQSGPVRTWWRSAAEGLPSIAESADGDWAFVEAS